MDAVQGSVSDSSTSIASVNDTVLNGSPHLPRYSAKQDRRERVAKKSIEGIFNAAVQAVEGSTLSALEKHAWLDHN